MRITLGSRGHEVAHRYAGGSDRPLPGYLLLTVGYTAMAGVLLTAARRRAGADQTRLDWDELALTAVSTYRLSRLLTTGQWVATSLVAGHVLAPGVTRLVTGILTATAGAEALHYGHAALQRLEPSHD